MYTLILVLHSLLRWVVLLLGALGLVRGATGGTAPWGAADETPRKWFPHALSLQFILGLVLLAVSPVAKTAFGDMGAAMKDPTLRFFSVEHTTAMIAVLALGHIGAARTRRATEVAAKRRTMMIFFGLAVLLMAWGIPWATRPLLRLG